MKKLLSSISMMSASLFLGGCCAFIPCHYSDHMAGTVTDAVSRRPVPDAAVRLYYYQARTAPSGCFALGGADSLPFEFSVSAPGYKPLVIRPKWGKYLATVTLVPEGSAGESVLITRETSEKHYAEFSRRCVDDALKQILLPNAE